jgi:hypothetical protein
LSHLWHSFLSEVQVVLQPPRPHHVSLDLGQTLCNLKWGAWTSAGIRRGNATHQRVSTSEFSNDLDACGSSLIGAGS